MRVRVRALAAGVAVILLGGVAACSEDTDGAGAAVVLRAAVRCDRQARALDDSEAPTPEPVRNDLARLPLKRALNAGSLTVNVEYNDPLADQGLAGGGQQAASRHDDRGEQTEKAGQKIYLSKVTVNVTAYDEDGRSRRPEDADGRHEHQPGIHRHLPEHLQPELRRCPPWTMQAIRLTIDITYELVLQVEQGQGLGATSPSRWPPTPSSSRSPAEISSGRIPSRSPRPLTSSGRESRRHAPPRSRSVSFRREAGPR